MILPKSEHLATHFQEPTLLLSLRHVQHTPWFGIPPFHFGAPSPEVGGENYAAEAL